MKAGKVLVRADILLQRSARFAWAIFLISLPVTSFPFFSSGLGSGTLVRPLAVYPLLILLGLVVLPRLLRGPLPRVLLAYLPFVLAALASVLLASLRGIEASQGISDLARMTRALITLGLGSAFYLAVILYLRSLDDLSASLRWLYFGLILALVWGTLQAVYVVHYSSSYFHWMNTLQHLVSIRKLFPKRISGLTYEPNWFAEQISTLYMPWLFACVLKGKSVFRLRWHFFSIELFLLAWSGTILFFTFSRSGLAIFLMFVFVSILLFLPRKKPQARAAPYRWLSENARRIGFAGLAVLCLVGLFFYIGQRNRYFSRLWSYWIKDVKTANYFEYIAFGQRFVYWQTAFQIFSDYPVLGVGLGNYAFYFADYLPERPYNTIPEILRFATFSQASGRLVTTKNMFARLLAETGMLGTATFVAFLLTMLACSLALWNTGEHEPSVWGLAGVFATAAFVLSAFSNDSFSVPNMWIVFGLITGAWGLFQVNQGGSTKGHSG